jgi:hypothetical protein
MPYIKRKQSIINAADACGGGMKKAGLVYGTDFNRVGRAYLKKNTVTNIEFKWDKSACCKFI